MATKQVYEVEIDRQKAAQAAGNYDLADLPGGLGEPVVGARIGKQPKQDKIIAGNVRSLASVTKLYPGCCDSDSG